MGGNQEPMTSPPPAAPATPSGPNALDTLMASMSRAELLVLAGGALIVLLEIVFLFVDGYSLSTTFFLAGALGAVLVFFRKSLPASLASIYWAVLLLLALAVTINGVRDVLLDVLNVARPGAGIGGAFLLGFLGTIAATAAFAWAALLMWRNRTA